MAISGDADLRVVRSSAVVPSRTRAVVPVGLAVMIAFTVEVIAILRATGGHFGYSLDDPYIHLALAEHLRHWHYGINAGEPSSPSSSILWPFLLASGPVRDWVPLAWNLLATIGSVLVIREVLPGRLRGWRAVAATVTATASLNLVGVAFTGMEHSLQVLLALLAGRGVRQLVREGTADPLLLVAIAVGPLVRYENASVSVAAAVVLALSGRARAAAAASAVWLTGVVGFSLMLLSKGLDPLPSSVLVKSPYADGARSPLSVLVARVGAAFLDHPMFLGCCIVVAADAMVLRRWTRAHFFAAFILAGHAVAGEFGWNGRYELYLLAALLPVFAAWATDWAGRVSRLEAALGVGIVVALISSTVPLAAWAWKTPAAAADIASQQAQTARFVREYWKRPIAVNDLGLVAFRGGQPVLDVYGLGSQEARRAREAGGQWLGRLVEEHGVDLAAIYDDWYAGQVPASWTKVGTLVGARRVASAERVVSYYATTQHAVPEACAAVSRFAADTPSFTPTGVCAGAPR